MLINDLKTVIDDATSGKIIINKIVGINGYTILDSIIKDSVFILDLENNSLHFIEGGSDGTIDREVIIPANHIKNIVFSGTSSLR